MSGLKMLKVQIIYKRMYLFLMFKKYSVGNSFLENSNQNCNKGNKKKLI